MRRTVDVVKNSDWLSIAAWPAGMILFLILIFFRYPMRPDSDYTPAYFYIIAVGLGLVAVIVIVKKSHGRADAHDRHRTKCPVISLVVAIIVLLAMLGAPARPDYRMKGWNAMALSELHNAQAAIETYHAEKKIYPSSLQDAGFKAVSNQDSVRVEIIYTRIAPDKYSLTSAHVNGDKEYRCGSESTVIQQRRKNKSEE